MLLNQLINISVIISTAFAIFLGALICYRLFKLNQLVNGVYKRVNNLGNEVTIDTIDDFINYINEKYEPTRYYVNDFIKAGYRLIDIDESVDQNLKGRVRKTILSKGILVD